MLLGHPGWLFLLVLLVPVVYFARSARQSLGPVRGVIVPVLRCLLVIFLVFALADPTIERRSDAMTVVVVVDRSDSVPSAQLEQAVIWIQDAMLERGEEDRIALVHVGRDAVPGLMPDPHGQVSLDIAPGRTDASDLAAGLELAKGLLPEDGVYRMLLVSDGNETVGSLRAAADLAAQSGIPIDVLPVVYRRSNEVLVERVVAPADAQPGQAIDVRVVLRSQGHARGRLVLLRNGIPVTADGGMSLDLEPGTAVVPVTIQGGEAPMQHFEAVFEPEPGGGDAIATNNRAAAVSFGSARGRVLVVAEGSTDAARLVEMLLASDLDATLGHPGELAGGAAVLAAWDAIVLVDVPRWSLSDAADGELAAWVSRGGGGLLVIGGPQAFGAGGWIGSKVEAVLPVGLDPPAHRQVRRGALALIVHSCEMPRGNYWGRRVADAAIESLGSQDLVGVIEYSDRTGDAQWSLPLEVAGDKQRALAATASLAFGDMQSFGPSMEMAVEDLATADAGQKHVVIISDGDPQPPSQELLDRFVQASVTVTTVMVGGHGTPVDRRRMQAIASITGGRFHDVKNPANLPRIFIREAQLVSRSLVQEGTYQPIQSGPAAGPIGDLPEGVPPIGGYVLTVARAGLSADALVVPTEEAADPLYAWWHHGIGRVVAFTSDLGARWARQWPGWALDAGFWERTIRWLMRPGDEGLFALTVREEDDGTVIADLEALDADSRFLNFLQTEAAVLGPGGVTAPLDLRQVGPGRYRGTFTMDQAGAWVVGVRYSGGRPETGEAVQGWTQAAVVRNWPAEAGAVSSNEALLSQVAQVTGGRVFTIQDDPAGVQIFDRTGLVAASGQRQAWALLAIIAAVILLMDVLVRRIVPDRERSAALARQAAQAAQHGGDQVADAWKRIRAQQHRRGATVESPVGTSTAAAPDASPSPDDEDDETEDDPDRASDTLARLREARRRARDEGGDP